MQTTERPRTQDRFMCLDCGRGGMTVAEKNNHHLTCPSETREPSTLERIYEFLFRVAEL